MGFKESITAQFAELSQRYDNLALYFDKNKAIIEGDILFHAKFKGFKSISDQYSIRIEVPHEFPQRLPETVETSGRVPRTFHTNDGKYLCLEVPAKIKATLKRNPTLIHYVDEYVVPYLFGYSHYVRTGKLPFGERSHGQKGKLEHYHEMFQTKDTVIILSYLRMLAKGRYRGHRLCYCGSGKRLRNCHKRKMEEYLALNMRLDYLEDYKEIKKYLERKWKENYGKGYTASIGH